MTQLKCDVIDTFFRHGHPKRVMQCWIKFNSAVLYHVLILLLTYTYSNETMYNSTCLCIQWIPIALRKRVQWRRTWGWPYGAAWVEFVSIPWSNLLRVPFHDRPGSTCYPRKPRTVENPENRADQEWTFPPGSDPYHRTGWRTWSCSNRRVRSRRCVDPCPHTRLKGPREPRPLLGPGRPRESSYWPELPVGTGNRRRTGWSLLWNSLTKIIVIINFCWLLY